MLKSAYEIGEPNYSKSSPKQKIMSKKQKQVFRLLHPILVSSDNGLTVVA